jgi:hypothetical protein
MAMLVPVKGNFDPSEVNRRRVPPIPKSLREQDPDRFPPVYIFNVGPRRHEFPPSEKGLRYLEACPAGKPYSKPLMLRCIEMEVYDLADGGGNMARLEEEGIDKALALIHSGVGISLDTPNLEWLGVFVSENETPTQKEIAEAKKKLMQYMRLVYDKGSELVQQGTRVDPIDRAIYNEAAQILGKSSMFGVDEHMMAKCAFCQESIVEGAVLCRHCGSRQDSEEAKKLRAQKATA